jgi:TPR repeat protein
VRRIVRRAGPVAVLLAVCAAFACTSATAADGVDSKQARSEQARSEQARSEQAGPKTTGAKAAAGAATPEEVAADPQRVWTRFLAEAELGAAYAPYDVVDAVGYDGNAVDADACREQARTLREAVVAVPVSIAIHRVAMLCAEATGDEAAAERETAALAALSRHALATRGDTNWHRPIPVLSPRDIYALVAVLGYEFRYEYYNNLHPQRYFPLVVVGWDPDAKVERHLVFDFIDTAFSIDREDAYAGFPFQRNLLADAFLKAQSKGDGTAAVDLLAARAAFTSANNIEKLGHLREGAARGGVASLTAWLVFCGTQPLPHCEEGLVDALLPLAEQRQAAPMTLLALAHAEGIGVKRDPKAAEALLEAADRRWHERGASMLFAAITRLLHPRARNDFVMERLRKSIEAGNADAEVMRVASEILSDDKHALSANEIGVLERPSSNQMGLGYAALAEYYQKRSMTVEMQAAMRKAADHGHAGSQRARAVMAIREGGEKTPRAAWWKDLNAAAQGGDAVAMRLLSSDAVSTKDWKAAASWLLAAVQAADLDALYDIAALYETGNAGLPGGLDDAIKLYEALSEDAGDNGVRARRRLASLAMEGRGMKRNPKRAVEWLQTDAARGDTESQVQLAGIYLRREVEGAGIADGKRWIERAIAAGSSDAKGMYGEWLVSWPEATSEDRARGLALLRETADGGDINARNNLAWALCVSPADDVRDPAAGLRIAKGMEPDPALDPGYIDTVAACYAATGDFAGAVRLQQRAIDGLPRNDKDKPQGGQGMFDRLDLYRAGKAYVDTPQ